ncbi:MAG: hypothetical protein EA427_09355 [Spirochaetaceae bacterium]|nr:MAG: hypothetical protein EA427_09355 [Spirochaetaceae bacterium]
MDTAKMVDDLMEIERIPVRRLERDVEKFEIQRRTWQDLGRNLTDLRDASRTLYGIDNPFRNRLGRSSDPAILTVSASRLSQEGSEEITVLQTAGRDRFASPPVDRDFRVQAGVYTFTLGETTRSFRYGGGTLQDFVEQVNRRVPDVVRGTIVPDTSTTRRLILEGQGEGAAAQLSFGDAARDLVEETGLLSPPRPDQSVSALETEPLRLEPGEEHSLRLERPFSIEPGMVLQFEARTEELPREPWEPPPSPPGPELPSPGSVTLEGVTVQDEVFGLDLPRVAPPEPPEHVEDNRAMTITGAGRRTELPALPERDRFETVTVGADRLLPETDGFLFANRNTDRALEIRNIRIMDPDAREGAVPTNAIETARDARILYSGIEITRPTNAIDDLIPGVTINLRRASPEPVRIDIEPDREGAKDAIINFAGFYNQAVRDINIYTRTDRSLIDQIDYFTPEERERMESRLGLFQGETTLNQLRSRMQTIMMDSYGSAEDEMRLLGQIGISSNAAGGGSLDMSRMRGYMEINEATLDRALESNFAAVGRLFGRDTTGDLIMDTGVAVAMERFITPYVRTGGIIAGRSSGLDTRIGQTETRIDRYNERLETTEQRLRREFGRMEGALEQMEEQTRAFDNLPGINSRQSR